MLPLHWKGVPWRANHLQLSLGQVSSKNNIGLLLNKISRPKALLLPTRLMWGCASRLGGASAWCSACCHPTAIERWISEQIWSKTFLFFYSDQVHQLCLYIQVWIHEGRDDQDVVGASTEAHWCRAARAACCLGKKPAGLSSCCTCSGGEGAHRRSCTADLYP